MRRHPRKSWLRTPQKKVLLIKMRQVLRCPSAISPAVMRQAGLRTRATFLYELSNVAQKLIVRTTLFRAENSVAGNLEQDNKPKICVRDSAVLLRIFRSSEMRSANLSIAYCKSMAEGAPSSLIENCDFVARTAASHCRTLTVLTRPAVFVRTKRRVG